MRRLRADRRKASPSIRGTPNASRTPMMAGATLPSHGLHRPTERWYRVPSSAWLPPLQLEVAKQRSSCVEFGSRHQPGSSGSDATETPTLEQSEVAHLAHAIVLAPRTTAQCRAVSQRAAHADRSASNAKLSDLARLTAERVCRVVAGATTNALAATQEWLVPFAHGMHWPFAPQYPAPHPTSTRVETVAFRTITLVATTGLGASVTSMPSSAERVETFLLLHADSALAMSKAGSSVMVITKSSATRRRKRARKRWAKRRRDVPKSRDIACRGRPSMPATWSRMAVSLIVFTSSTSIWSGSCSTVWLTVCCTTSVFVCVCCPSGTTIGMLPGMSLTSSCCRPGQKPHEGQVLGRLCRRRYRQRTGAVSSPLLHSTSLVCTPCTPSVPPGSDRSPRGNPLAATHWPRSSRHGHMASAATRHQRTRCQPDSPSTALEHCQARITLVARRGALGALVLALWAGVAQLAPFRRGVGALAATHRCSCSNKAEGASGANGASITAAEACGIAVRAFSAWQRRHSAFGAVGASCALNACLCIAFALVAAGPARQTSALPCEWLHAARAARCRLDRPRRAKGACWAGRALAAAAEPWRTAAPAGQSKHWARPVTLANVPALHGLGGVRPPGHHFATGHVAQSPWLRKATPDRRNVPSSQDAGMRALEPGGHMKPSPHVMHSVAPALPWYLPSTHMGHCWLFPSAVAVPFPHGVGELEPAKQ
eukprot:scaffold16691_cov74-Phaeocystis_antarctica.AAC.1